MCKAFNTVSNQNTHSLHLLFTLCVRMHHPAYGRRIYVVFTLCLRDQQCHRRCRLCCRRYLPFLRRVILGDKRRVHHRNCHCH